jgi:hypothetical protein
MKNNTEKARKNAQTADVTLSDDRTQLDRRYGQIGISAVAAAVRYQGTAKNPAYAPVPMPRDERADEAA